MPIKKDKAAPAEGDYDTYSAWKKTQLGNREYQVPKAALKNFTDIYKQKKKFVPGAGHYKLESTVYDKLSASPAGVKVHRH